MEDRGIPDRAFELMESKGGIIEPPVPFAAMGGVWFMWMLGYEMSVTVAVGFIALAGVAAGIGGMISVTVLALPVVPVVYSLWRKRQVRKSTG